MDIVYIRELAIKTTIGVYDWERDIKQQLNIDLDLGCDTSKAGQSDEIEDALDYKAISDRTIEFAEASQYQLVEALAENLARVILDEFSLPWLRIKVSKPGAVSGAKDVGVIIERGVKT